MHEQPSYWANVARIAGARAMLTVQWKDREHAAVTIAVAVVSMVLAILVLKDKSLAESIVYTILVGIAAIVVVFAVVFVIQMVAIPPQLAAEHATAFTKDLAPLRARVDDLEKTGAASAGDKARLGQLASENERLRTQLATVQLELGNERLENVGRALWRLVEAAPKEEGYTEEKGRTWHHSVDRALDSIAPGATYRFQYHGDAYIEIHQSVLALIAIAGSLRITDLRT